MKKLFGKSNEKSPAELENERFSTTITNFMDKRAHFFALQIWFMQLVIDLLVYMILRLNDPLQSQPFVERADNFKTSLNGYIDYNEMGVDA